MTYSVKQICDRYDVNEHTVLAWIHAGELKAINVGVQPGKKKPRWRCTQQAVEEFEALRARTPAAPPIKRSRKSKPSTEVTNFIK